jgi:hypothetical protein
VSAPLYAGVQILGFIVFGATMAIILAKVGYARGWPVWFAESLLDAAYVPLLITLAIGGVLVVEPRDQGQGFLVVDSIMALLFAWFAWKTFKNNRNGEYAPSSLGGMVMNLARRIGN